MATVVLGTPAVLYKVLVPFDVLETQKGLVGDAEMPHVPTRLGSVLSAVPETSATRLCCVKFVAANTDTAVSAAAKTPAARVDFFPVFIVSLLLEITSVSQNIPLDVIT